MRSFNKPYRKREGWYRPRAYSHFDEPISEARAAQLVTDPEAVARHAFFPFIKRVVRVDRYKANDSGTKEVKLKKRPICFASHVDSHVFAYYADILTKAYDDRLDGEVCEPCVIAYRSLSKTNIHFAAEAFDDIRQNAPCAVLAFDVKSFFDTLDHDLLKREWAALLDVDRLPDDHYAVFRTVTRFAFVKERRLKKLFQKHYIQRKKDRRRRGRKGRRPRVPRICSPQQFRDRVRREKDRGRSLIAVNEAGKGIPQGSPISAVLANLYMLPFDLAFEAYVSKVGGVYRRYSDDLLVICPLDKAVEVEKTVNEMIAERKIKLGKEKTERFVAKPVQDTLSITKMRADGTDTGEAAEVQYLGFVFDGKVVRLRPNSLTKYYRRMGRAVMREKERVQEARKTGEDAQFSSRRLYRGYSHVGSTNFPRYAYRAAKEMNSPAIRRQLRRHAMTLDSLLKRHEQGYAKRIARNQAHRQNDKARRSVRNTKG
ncbi:MAG: antiviral reverse transcriptase Drt2 [Bacteroidota bacterium]